MTTVTLNLERANVAPVALGESYTTNEDVVLTVAAPGVMSNDLDGDGDAITATLAIAPVHGTVVLNANGSFVYTPAANYAGPDSFSYTVTDGRAVSNVATVSLTVVATNRAPVAGGDAFTTNEDSPLVVTAPGVLVGDTDPRRR